MIPCLYTRSAPKALPNRTFWYPENRAAFLVESGTELVRTCHSGCRGGQSDRGECKHLAQFDTDVHEWR